MEVYGEFIGVFDEAEYGKVLAGVKPPWSVRKDFGLPHEISAREQGPAVVCFSIEKDSGDTYRDVEQGEAVSDRGSSWHVKTYGEAP